MARKMAFGVAEDEVEVTLQDDGTATLGIQGPNEQDYMSAGTMPAEEMAEELRALADFLDQRQTVESGMPLRRDSLLDPRIRGLNDAQFRLYIGLRTLATPESNGLVTMTYGSLWDLGRLLCLDDPVDPEGTPLDEQFVTACIRALEAVDLVRHDANGQRLVIMR